MYSISTNFYPENKESMVGFIEAVTGVGLIMGPLIGSFLYAVGGYRFIFFSFGSLFVIASFFIKVIFPSTIDNIGVDAEDNSSEKENSSIN
jgi:MFS family permease